MEPALEPALLIVTLVCGFVVSRIGFPPLIGYLIAGFVLYLLGLKGENLPLLHMIADTGIMLLLFAIGLKLDLKSLLKAEVWVSSSVHLIIFMSVGLILFKAAIWLGFSQLAELNNGELILLAFAISFSSTVFAVKTLEEKGEMESLYGQISISILIIQDLFAVIFLTLSTGETPSIYALSLLALPITRPLIYRIFDHVGHSDLLVLFGLTMSLLCGAYLFDVVGLKPDLGSLIMGILLSQHPKASELAKSLFYFKELFLVTFFLSIGLKGLPNLSDLLLAVVLLLILPIKGMLFLALLTRFKLRARTAFLASSTLMNYSEFGLIVAAVAHRNGWFQDHLIITLALALSLSFLIAAPFNTYAEAFYHRFQRFFGQLERIGANSEDRPIHIGTPKYLILGMGQIGTGAYDELIKHYGNVVVGIDHKADLIGKHKLAGRNVVLGDASDTDFWFQLKPGKHIEQVLLAMPHHHGNVLAFEQLKASGFQGKVNAIALYQDEIEKLEKLGIDKVFNIYESAGYGFVEYLMSNQKNSG